MSDNLNGTPNITLRIPIAIRKIKTSLSSIDVYTVRHDSRVSMSANGTGGYNAVKEVETHVFLQN